MIPSIDGVSGRPSHRGAGTGSCMCLSAIVIGVSPSNGSVPVTISYRTTPSEYRSAVCPTPKPRACSGERYWTEPSTVPVSVIVVEASARAIPKSVTFT